MLHAAVVPHDCKQLILGLAENWNDSHVRLQFYQRDAAGAWQAQGESFAGRLGRDGLAWGRGLHPVPWMGNKKKEGDWRSPAGVFRLGSSFTTLDNQRWRGGWPVYRVRNGTLWVEDINSKHYNQLLELGRPTANAWERQQQMKLDDPHHSLKLLIEHNSLNCSKAIKPAAGSSIFFHMWRQQGKRPSAGCTTMSEPNMRLLLNRLRVQSKPVYVLLPKAEYQKYRKDWALP